MEEAAARQFLRQEAKALTGAKLSPVNPEAGQARQYRAGQRKPGETPVSCLSSHSTEEKGLSDTTAEADRCGQTDGQTDGSHLSSFAPSQERTFALVLSTDNLEPMNGTPKARGCEQSPYAMSEGTQQNVGSHAPASQYGRTFRRALKCPASQTVQGQQLSQAGFSEDWLEAGRCPVLESELTSCHYLLVGGTVQVREGPCSTPKLIPPPKPILSLVWSPGAAVSMCVCASHVGG